MLFTVTQSGYGGDVTGRKRDIDYLQGEIQELFAAFDGAGNGALRPSLVRERQAAAKPR